MRELSVPARGEGAAGSGQEAALVKELEGAIRARLEGHEEAGQPPLSAGVEPLLDKVRQARLELFPSEGEQPPPPRKRDAVRAELAKTLDETEDVLEALLLAVPGASGGGGVG